MPPTTGYVVYMPKKNLVVLDMSVEDAAKLLLSAGLVMPEYPKAAAQALMGGAHTNGRAVTVAATAAGAPAEARAPSAPIPVSVPAEESYTPPRPIDRPR